MSEREGRLTRAMGWIKRHVLRRSAGENRKEALRRSRARVNMAGVLPIIKGHQGHHPEGDQERTFDAEVERIRHQRKMKTKHHDVQPDLLAAGAVTQATHPAPLRVGIATNPVLS